MSQGTVLGPLLFSLFINDIFTDIDSEIRLFADDCVCCREIRDTDDSLKLQKDIDRIEFWASNWGARNLASQMQYNADNKEKNK